MPKITERGTMGQRASVYRKEAKSALESGYSPRGEGAEAYAHGLRKRANALAGATYDPKYNKPRDTHEIARKAAATRKAHGGGLSGNLAKAGAHAKR